MQVITRRAAAEPWPVKSWLGNHRALIEVTRASECARLRLDWRRRDLNPEKIGQRLICLEDGKEIYDIMALNIERESCDILFRAPVEGRYALYYMPYRNDCEYWYFPAIKYMRPDQMRPDPDWLKRAGAGEDVCRVIALEARNEFELFGEMETPATRDEVRKLTSGKRCKWIMFTEDRHHPVVMGRELPYRWMERGPSSRFTGSAKRGEYYVFQICLYALERLDDVQVEFVNARGIDAASLSCLNAGGFDWLHRPFSRRISAEAGDVLPVWICVDLGMKAGDVSFDVELECGGYNERAEVTLNVSEEIAPEHGDADIRNLSRLRWLNSGIGLDDKACDGWDHVLWVRFCEFFKSV